MSQPEPSREESDADLVWPPAASKGDIVWLHPPTVPDPPAGVPEPATAATTTPLPVSCFLSPDVPLEWHEAVAIVQQLAEQITDGFRIEPSGSLPDVRTIGIESTGYLLVRLDSRGRESVVRGLGSFLRQLLATRNCPVGLQALVAQVVTFTPAIRSVEALSRELERWERPRRLEKLAELHDRGRRLIETRSAATLLQNVEPTPAPVVHQALTDVSELQHEARWSTRLRSVPRSLVAHGDLIGGVFLGLSIIVSALIWAAPHWHSMSAGACP